MSLGRQALVPIAASTRIPSTPAGRRPWNEGEASVRERVRPVTPNDAEWAELLLDRLDRAIALVRASSTDRLVRFAELVVYGLVAAVMATMSFLMLIIGSVRLLVVILPSGVWLADVILGTTFLGVGLFLWSKRIRPELSSTSRGNSD